MLVVGTHGPQEVGEIHVLNPADCTLTAQRSVDRSRKLYKVEFAASPRTLVASGDAAAKAASLPGRRPRRARCGGAAARPHRAHARHGGGLRHSGCSAVCSSAPTSRCSTTSQNVLIKLEFAPPGRDACGVLRSPATCRRRRATCRWRRSTRARPRTWPPATRSRCTARSVTPRSTTSSCS
ncbi:hypothetical protein ACU686_30860 [Yinghuangia aomiensis]